MREDVVLLGPTGTPIGSEDKSVVHSAHTPLHLAFSCHVRDSGGRVLVSRRALSKSTWPGVWTNAFCGHPAPDEEMGDAIRRRARRELGIEVRDIQPLLSDFRYEAVDASGVRENEICPVFSAVTDDEPIPAADEVAEYEWVTQAALASAVPAAPWAFSPWFVAQLARLGVDDESQQAVRTDGRRSDD